MTEAADDDRLTEPGLEASLSSLDTIIANERASRSPMGIFPSMYRSVTAEIRDAVQADFFDDSEAMERLAVLFAGRYIDAYDEWTSGNRPRESWRVAFEAATDGRRRMVTQHLLAGMNAHINLDLGIVTAAVAGARPAELHQDFLRVNLILFRKLDGLQSSLGSVSNRMAWIDRLGGTLDERLMKLAIGDARDAAWDFSVDLVSEPNDAEQLIKERDRATAGMGRTILGGTLPVRALSEFVARSEPSDVRSVLDAFLEGTISLDGIDTAPRGEHPDARNSN